VLARQPSRSFDGEWRNDAFGRTAMIRAFPRNAMMERGMLMAEIVMYAFGSVRLDDR